MTTLYRKYRPQTFSEISGQPHIIRTLTNAIKNNRVGQAYLLTGPRGTGKTTIARVFAKTINCLEQQAPKEKNDVVKVEPCNKCASCKLILNDKAIDLIEIDAASHTGVDNIRQLRETIPLPPTALRYKTYIIDEVHMLSIGAFNALLKTLEEPPAHALFILATTELHKVPETIISRCQRFDIVRLTQAQIIERLRQIAKSERVEIEDEALEAIAVEADGGMRDAESLLGQIIALEDQTITAREVHEILGTSPKKLVITFTKALAENDNSSCLNQIDALQKEGVNLNNFNKLLLSFFRTLLLLKTNPDEPGSAALSLSKEQLNTARVLAKKIELTDIVRLIELFQKSLEQFKEATIPQLPLEMAAIEYCLEKNYKVPEGRKEQIDNGQRENNEKVAENKLRKTAKKNLPPSELDQEENKKNKPVSTPPEEKIEKKQGSMKKSTADVTLENVIDKWSEILEQVKPHNHSIHAFLKNCTPCGVADGTVYIKTKYNFYKDKLSETNNLLTVQKSASIILDTALKVKFVTEQECENMDFGNKNGSKDKKRNILHDAMQVLGGRIVKE